MKTFPYYSENKKLLSFEISNSFCGRKKATKIVERIPEVIILRKPKGLFSWFREDIFCEFELEGVHFEIEEPFGDNSRYLISTSQKGNSKLINTVLEAFNAA